MCASASGAHHCAIYYYLSDGVNSAALHVGRNVIGRGTAPVGAPHFICLESPRAAVSRYQAVIDIAANGDAWVRDCNSTNGTFLSQRGHDTGMRLESDCCYMLCAGCRVTFGDVACYIRTVPNVCQGVNQPPAGGVVGCMEGTEQRMAGCNRDDEHAALLPPSPQQQPQPQPSMSAPSLSNQPHPLDADKHQRRPEQQHDGAAATDRPARLTNSPTDAAGGVDALSTKQTGCTSVPPTCVHSATTLHATSNPRAHSSRHGTAVSQPEAVNAAEVVPAADGEGELPVCSAPDALPLPESWVCYAQDAQSDPRMEDRAGGAQAQAQEDEKEEECLLDSHMSASSMSSSIAASDTDYAVCRKRTRTAVEADTDAVAPKTELIVDDACELVAPEPRETARTHAEAGPEVGVTDEAVVVLASTEAEPMRVGAGSGRSGGRRRGGVCGFSACVSGLDGQQRELVKRAIRQHGGRVVEDVVKAAMLVVPAPAARTPKFLIALGRGIPVVSEHLFTSSRTFDVRDLTSHIVPLSHQGVVYSSDTIRRVIYRGDRTPLMHGVSFDLSRMSKSVRRTAEEVIVGCGGTVGKAKSCGGGDSAHKLCDEDVASIFDSIVQGKRSPAVDAPGHTDSNNSNKAR